MLQAAHKFVMEKMWCICCYIHVKEGLYRIKLLCRRHPYWSYPAGLTIADLPPAGLTKAEVSPSLFTLPSPSLFTPHQILYSPSLIDHSSPNIILVDYNEMVDNYKAFALSELSVLRRLQNRVSLSTLKQGNLLHPETQPRRVWDNIQIENAVKCQIGKMCCTDKCFKMDAYKGMIKMHAIVIDCKYS